MIELTKYKPTGFAAKIFKDRYAIHLNETFAQACKRVATFTASAEEGDKIKHFEKRFLNIMNTNRFSPGGRIWRNAGRKRSPMINCFVLESHQDSREGWGELLRRITIISGLGGGVGINFGNIRPRGSDIKGMGGTATGAVSLMKIVNSVCDELRSGGARRSALLFGLPYDHPDLEEFLNVKLDKKELTNANISVLIDNKFFDLVESNGDIELKWQGKVHRKIKAKWLYDKIIINSLLSGDPGFINLGNAEKYNNLYWCRKINCCNPCGEQMLPSDSVCCLGSLILSNHLDQNNEIDWNLLDDTIGLAVRFLDDVLEKNEFPFGEIRQISQQERRIGLGVMGLHDLLLKMGVKYSSEKALGIIDKLMNFIKKKAYNASIFLSVEKGQFPLLDREKFIHSGFCKESLTPSIRKKILEHGIRNCCLLTSPPTGTTSIVAGVSSGIEPIFAPIYQRNFDMHNGKHASCEVIIHPLLARFMEQKLDYTHFEGAHEITPEQHCWIQKICQEHIDSSISKTINLPSTATKEELSEIILKYIRNLKGITIYREGSRGKSPLAVLPLSEAQRYLKQAIEGAAINDCPTGVCDIEKGGS